MGQILHGSARTTAAAMLAGFKAQADEAVGGHTVTIRVSRQLIQRIICAGRVKDFLRGVDENKWPLPYARCRRQCPTNASRCQWISASIWPDIA